MIAILRYHKIDPKINTKVHVLKNMDSTFWGEVVRLSSRYKLGNRMGSMDMFLDMKVLERSKLTQVGCKMMEPILVNRFYNLRLRCQVQTMCTHVALVCICQPCVNKSTHGAALGCLSSLTSLFQ
jgi:hypothetical protein